MLFRLSRLSLLQAQTVASATAVIVEVMIRFVMHGKYARRLPYVRHSSHSTEPLPVHNACLSERTLCSDWLNNHQATARSFRGRCRSEARIITCPCTSTFRERTTNRCRPMSKSRGTSDCTM